MNYEEFKENLFNSEVEFFSIQHVIHSDDELLHPLVRKIAENIWWFGFMPPGQVFQVLTDSEVFQIKLMFSRLNPDKFDPEDETIIYDLRHASFNLATLVQVMMFGEGDASTKTDANEIRHYMHILENFVKVETVSRKGIGVALRQNYSFFDIDKPIYLKG